MPSALPPPARPPAASSSIAICIAAFNRREKTLACLRSLQRAARPDGLEIAFYLLDDASDDGTAQAVHAQFPSVQIERGTGSLFWAGGMRVAYAAALRHRHAYYIWMNDDVVARPDALVRLVETERRLFAKQGRHHIVTGAMWDPALNEPSYGGYNLTSRVNPGKIELVLPDDTAPKHVDLTNANMLLIPAAIADALGNIPAAYSHTLGDWDYGLQAKAAGFGTALAPGYAGDCAGNVAWRRRWHAPGMTLRQRYRAMLGPLALPFRSRAYFLLRHFPFTAPFFIFAPYLKLPFDHFLKLGRSAPE